MKRYLTAITLLTLMLFGLVSCATGPDLPSTKGYDALKAHQSQLRDLTRKFPPVPGRYAIFLDGAYLKRSFRVYGSASCAGQEYSIDHAEIFERILSQNMPSWFEDAEVVERRMTPAELAGGGFVGQVSVVAAGFSMKATSQGSGGWRESQVATNATIGTRFGVVRAGERVFDQTLTGKGGFSDQAVWFCKAAQEQLEFATEIAVYQLARKILGKLHSGRMRTGS